MVRYIIREEMLYIFNNNNYTFHKNLFHFVRHTTLINLENFDEIYYAE